MEQGKRIDKRGPKSYEVDNIWQLQAILYYVWRFLAKPETPLVYGCIILHIMAEYRLLELSVHYARRNRPVQSYY